ncbi:unnamed protein product [Brachionus calyciflorus]|uniref:Uncharacterized protein n=1 Tax=Brachionus calyciflorus TaxID=104777 RepID=A0A814LL33_9BILA|nr:unnamed protein product [Brachionus calyciflorus]
MESGCVVITPNLFKHLISKSSSKIEKSILEKDETETLNQEDLKVRTIESQNLLKYHLKDKNEENNSFKVEITVNLNQNSSNSTDAQQLQVNKVKDNEKIEFSLNCTDRCLAFTIAPEVNLVGTTVDFPQVVNSTQTENASEIDHRNAQETIEANPIEITNDIVEEVTKTI